MAAVISLGIQPTVGAKNREINEEPSKNTSIQDTSLSESSLHTFIKKIADEVTKIREGQDAMKADLSKVKDQVKSEMSKLEGLRYVSYGFTEFGVTFHGRGYPNREATTTTNGVSRDECFSLCVDQKEKGGKEWSGFVYSQQYRFCQCYKNPTGFYARSDCFYYRFES